MVEMFRHFKTIGVGKGTSKGGEEGECRGKSSAKFFEVRNFTLPQTFETYHSSPPPPNTKKA